MKTLKFLNNPTLPHMNKNLVNKPFRQKVIKRFNGKPFEISLKAKSRKRIHSNFNTIFVDNVIAGRSYSLAHRRVEGKILFPKLNLNLNFYYNS